MKLYDIKGTINLDGQLQRFAYYSVPKKRVDELKESPLHQITYTMEHAACAKCKRLPAAYYAGIDYGLCKACF